MGIYRAYGLQKSGESDLESGNDIAKQLAETMKICDSCLEPYIGEHTCSEVPEALPPPNPTAPGAESESASGFKPGTMIGDNYEVVSVLGEGGMGIVLKARDGTLNRMVAVKVVHSRLLTDKGSLARFKQEAAASGSLDHPNIIRIAYFGVDQKQRPYIVMDFLSGKSLSDVLDERPLSLQEAVPILTQICDALQHAHDKGVVHRDLKPSNVMLLPREDGTHAVKLVDFGIAKVLPSQGYEGMKLTTTGEVLGSPLYMSPEQCLAMELDPRSDIYSMGCLIYATLTGKPPFINANVYETYYQHINDLPPSVGRGAPDLKDTGAVDAVILKCMAKEPQDRYQTMSELGGALRQLLYTQDKKGFAHELTGTVKLLSLKAKAGKIKVPGWAWPIGGAIALSGIGAIAWYCGVWMQPAEAHWKTLYMKAQTDMNNGTYVDAEKELNEALMLARSSAPMSKYVLPTMIEQTDLKALMGNPESYIAELKRLKSTAAADARVDTSILVHLQESIDRAKKGNLSEDDKERMRSLCGSAYDDIGLHLKLHEFDKVDEELDKCSELTAICGDPGDSLAKRNWGNRGNVALAREDAKTAKTCYQQCLTLYSETHDPNTYKIYNSLASIDYKLGDATRAKETYQNALEAARNQYGVASQQVAMVKLTFGEFLLNVNNKARAIEELEQARRLYDSVNDADPEDRARCYALIAFATGDRAKIEQAVSMMEEALRKDDFYLSWLLEQLADSMQSNQASRVIANAGPLYKRAFVIALRALPRDQQFVDRLMNRLDTWYFARNELLQIKPFYILQLAQDEDQFGKNCLQVAEDHRLLGAFYRRLGNITKAEENYVAAVNSFDALGKGRSWSQARACAELAMLYLDQNKPEPAKKYFDRVDALMQEPMKIDGKPGRTIDEAVSAYLLYLDRTKQIEKKTAMVEKLKVAFKKIVQSGLNK